MSCPYCKHQTPDESHDVDCALYDGEGAIMMIVAYLVPVTKHGGFSTRVAETTRREVWCLNCATPCDKTLSVPADHIEINADQVGPGYDTCAACGKSVKDSA